MNNIKVSVIIPVYNGEKFLEKNLLNLSAQTLQEIEFIVVNDCSTDNSLNILTAFKQVFPDKFVIINSNKNRGPGGARNIGLKYAKGEYIGFVDADDEVNPQMFEKMYNEAVSGNYDIVSCSFYNEGLKKYFAPYDVKGEMTDKEKLFCCTISFLLNKIFKKSLIDNMSMHFRENIIYEDTDFTFEATVRSKTASSIPDVLYIYKCNLESLTKTAKYSEEAEYKAESELFKSIDKRGILSGNYEIALLLKDYFIKLHICASLKFLFCKPNFSLKDFEKYHNFVIQFLPDYYNVKYNDTKDFDKLIFNNLTPNIKESYKNLINFRKKIESGELDKAMSLT